MYRPIESVSFFAINQTNQLEIDNSDYNDQDDIEEDEFVYSHPYLSCNQFIGYQNNADIADNILEEMKSIPDQNTSFDYSVTDSYMQSFYEDDWNPDINTSPTMYWWRPTAINDNPQSEIQIWADKDVNWQNLNQSPEFNPQWIQNYNPNSGLHYKGVQKLIHQVLMQDLNFLQELVHILVLQKFFMMFQHLNHIEEEISQMNRMKCIQWLLV